MKASLITQALSLACLVAAAAFTGQASASGDRSAMDERRSSGDYGTMGDRSVTGDRAAGDSATDRPAARSDRPMSRDRDEMARDRDEMARDREGDSRFGATVSDAAITTKVKAALLAEPDLRSTGIHVETNGGVVQLSGFVGSREEANRAADVARSVEDVRSVENNIETR